MIAKIRVTFDMEFDSDNGNSKSSVGFELPEHPRVEITNRMKELAIEEAFALSRAMLNRNIFAENAQNPATGSTNQDHE